MYLNDFNDYSEKKGLEPSFIEELKKLSPAEKAEFENLALRLLPSANLFREFYQLAKEISAIKQISVAEIFAENEFLEILSSESKLSPKDKQKKIKLLLEKKRYPETERITKELTDIQKSIVKKYNIKLNLPEELEGDSVSLNINLNSPEQLEAIASKLSSLSQDAELEKIFSILKGKL